MTRRGFCRIMPALAAGSPLGRSQVISPLGNISVAGPVATFWADFVRPLQSVADTFVERYRWLVTFEEAPLIYAGDYVDVTRNPAAGGRALAPRGGYLQFSFDVGPEGEPADPGLVLRTALEAYHRAGFPGRYELRAEEGYFHIVPTARADVTGVLRAVRSPLDATVTLEGGGRNPNLVIQELLKSLELVSGYRVGGGFFPTPLSGDFRIEQRFENANARAVLRAILRAIGGRRTWLMMWGIWDRRYILSIVRIPEEDELKGAAGKRGGWAPHGEIQG